MPDGWGYAVGEGAEAASGAFHQTLNYKVALGLQQLRVGIEKEKLAMDRDRQALEAEQIQDALDRSEIEQKTLKLDYDTKLARSQIRAEAEKTIKAGEFVGPPVTGTAPSAQKVVQAYATVGREPTGRMEEAAMTPFQLRMRDAQLESEKALGASRRALSVKRQLEDIPDVAWDQQTPDDRLEITKVFENLSFANIELKQKYKSAQSWFDGDIRGVQPAPSQVAPGSDAQELKSLGYTLDHLNNPEYAKELQNMGYNVESAKANWNAE